LYYWKTKEASLKEDDDEKIELLHEAVYLYQGDFLERQIGLNWITRENWRCRKLFAETVNTLAKLLKENGRYEMLERLGLYAARIQPFSDWETLTMEAFISMGKTEAAYQLFDDTIDLYLHQQKRKNDNSDTENYDSDKHRRFTSLV
jgi:two-component SAPR family response regulator